MRACLSRLLKLQLFDASVELIIVIITAALLVVCLLDFLDDKLLSMAGIISLRELLNGLAEGHLFLL